MKTNRIIKLFAATLLTLSISSVAGAKTEKSEHCPSIEQIRIMRISKPWTHIYTAYNNERKYFVSAEYVEDDHNGPAPPLELVRSSYDASTKTLSCVYIAFARSENSHPILVNVGDY